LNRNKVLNLDTESSTIDKTFQVGSDVSTVTRTTVGQPIGQFWGYKVIGRFEKAEDFYYKDANGNVKAVALPEGSSIAKDKTWIGDYIFEDINGDGKINNEDETFIAILTLISHLVSVTHSLGKDLTSRYSSVAVMVMISSITTAASWKMYVLTAIY
jgi:hypothetical protein